MKRNAKKCWSILVFILLAHPGLASAPKIIVQWHVKEAPPKGLKPGTKFEMVISGKIDPGWHLYALEEPEGGPVATVIGLAEGDPVDLLRVEQGDPKIIMDPVFQQSTGLFENVADFKLHLQLAKEIAPGAHTIHVLVRFQSCDDHVCLAPHTDIVEVPLQMQR